MITRPILLLLGGVAALLLLRFGRRKVLIMVDIAMIANAFLACFNNWVTFYGCELLIYVFFSLNYLVVLLLCKEIPPFMYNGMPLVMLNAFEYLGYIIALAVVYACYYIYHIGIPASGQLLFRIVSIGVGSIPALLQLLLLLCLYRYEPPGYSMDQCSEEDAITSLKQVCTNHQFVMSQIAKLRDMIDCRKFSVVNWNTFLCNAKWRKAWLGCVMLLLVKFVAGFYSYALPGTQLNLKRYLELMLIAQTTFFFAVVLSAFIIDKYSLYFILLFGNISAIVINCGLVSMFAVFIYTGKYLTVLCAFGVIESAVHMGFLLAPVYKLLIGLLPDKGLLVAVVIQFLGYMFLSYPLTVPTVTDKRWLALGIQIAYTCGSFLMLILIVCYVPQHSQSLRRSSVSIVWRLQLELVEKATTSSESGSFVEVN